MRAWAVDAQARAQVAMDILNARAAAAADRQRAIVPYMAPGTIDLGPQRVLIFKNFYETYLTNNGLLRLIQEYDSTKEQKLIYSHIEELSNKSIPDIDAQDPDRFRAKIGVKIFYQLLRLIFHNPFVQILLHKKKYKGFMAKL